MPPAMGSSSGTSLSSLPTMSASSRAPSVGRPRAGRQHVVEYDDAARPEQPHPCRQVLRVGGLVGVAEHQVVGAVGQPRQHVERAAEDEPRLVGGEAGLRERLARQPVILGLGVHAGEHAAGTHAAQQPDAGAAAAGTDLYDRARRYRAREEPQRGTRGRRHGHGPAEVLGVGSGGEQRFILNRVRRLVVVDDCPLAPGRQNLLFTREPSQFRWSVEPYADGDR